MGRNQIRFETHGLTVKPDEILVLNAPEGLSPTDFGEQVKDVLGDVPFGTLCLVLPHDSSASTMSRKDLFAALDPGFQSAESRAETAERMGPDIGRVWRIGYETAMRDIDVLSHLDHDPMTFSPRFDLP